MPDFNFPEDEHLEPRRNWQKPSKAVVASNNGGGCVLWTAGPHVASMIDEAGVSNLCDLGLDDAPEGISIWEGGIKTVHFHSPDCNEYDSSLIGSFRAPTPAEWESIMKAECPWCEDDWNP